MDLVVTATPLEIQGVRNAHLTNVQCLVAGVGLVETTYNLTTYLGLHPEVNRVINLGVAGGFASENIAILDACLAQDETIADLGICFDDSLDGLDPSFLANENKYICDNPFATEFAQWLTKQKYPFHQGGFLSVNGVSGTTARGQIIHQRQAICENMEGAGVARVCHGLGLDWLEFRVISNLVEDRDLTTWRIQDAIDKYTGILLSFLQDKPSC